MQDRDWAHVHVSERQVTFDGTIHNLNSNLQIQMTVPKHYFGEAKNESRDDTSNHLKEDLKSDSEEQDWSYLKVQGIPLTSSIVGVC